VFRHCSPFGEFSSVVTRKSGIAQKLLRPLWRAGKRSWLAEASNAADLGAAIAGGR